MNFNLMALEDLEVSEVSSSETTPIDLGEVMNEGAEPDELLTYNRDLSVYVDALELADKATEILSTTAAQDGVSHVVCEALQQALDCLLRPASLAYTTQPAFEEMSTLRSRLRNRELALEGLREIATKVWDALIAMLRRMRDWFMSFFRRNKIQTRVLEEKLERAAKVVAEMKAKRAHQPKPSMPLMGDNAPEPHKARLSLTQKRHLMVGHAVPVGAKFIQHFHDFMAQSKEFRDGFAKFDHEVLRDLKDAVNAIDNQNNAFQTAFAKAHEAVWMSPLSKQAHKQPPLSKGVTLFMEPLAFGNMSFYRTAVTGTSNPQTTDAMAYVAAAPGFDEQEIGDAAVEALAEVQWEVVLKLCADEMKLMRAYEDEDHVAPQLESLLHDMERLSKSAQQDKRTRSRAVQLHKLLGIYNSFRASGMQALLKYQKNVVDGALEYAVTSVH